MVQFSDSLIVQNDKKIQSDIVGLSERFLNEDEIVHIGVKSQFKEYLIASDKGVLIYKKGFLTGRTFGESVFRMSYDSIAAIEMTTQAFGAGYIEVIAQGVNNAKPNAWAVRTDIDPSQLENCFSVGRKGEQLLNPVYKRLYEIFQNYKNKSNSLPIIENNDKFEEIKKFKELLELGIISEKEYEEKRTKLLNL